MFGYTVIKEEELAKLRVANSTATRDLRAAQRNITHLNDELIATIESRDEINTRAENLQNDVDKLRKDLREKNNDQFTYGTDLATLNKHHVNLVQSLDEIKLMLENKTTTKKSILIKLNELLQI